MLDASAANIVAHADGAVLLHEKLRHEKQRKAASAGGRIRQARQNEMDDIVGHVVLAIGDEYFLTEDAVGSAWGPLGPRLDGIEIGARLRLGEIHRARPFAGDEFAKINPAQVRVRISIQGADRAFGQQWAKSKAHRGSVPQFGAGRVDRMGQPHAAIFSCARHAAPAARRPSAIGVAKSWRRRHMAVFVAGAFEIADPIERRDDVGGETPGLGDNRGGGVGIELAEHAGFDRRIETGDMAERKQDIGNRRAIGHWASSAV
jgi:hypothetical protein